VKCEICIDVDDVAREVHFYGDGIGLSVVKQESEGAQMKVGELTIWLMKVSAGKAGAISRDYSRHWTPVHLDVHVDDIERTIAVENWKRGPNNHWPSWLILRVTASI
jgi:catechol 2,3-dioxygenase-like lactoylglutathione lyase family enzyme